MWGRYVELTKVSSYLTGDDYVPGLRGGFTSLPEGFKLTGYLIKEVKLGECVEIKVDRGLIYGGRFVSNPVTQITKDGFKTKGAVYTLTIEKNI